jgi:Ca-activated chloride channel homolog
MKPSNDQFETNIAHLVKLTRGSDRPSDEFIRALTQSALVEFQNEGKGRTRAGKSVPMKLRKILSVAGIAALLIVSLVVFYQMDRDDQPSRLSISTHDVPQALSIKLPASTHEAPLAWVSLPIVLPRPMFVGTPTNMEGLTRLERRRGGPRAPFLAPQGATNVALGKPMSGSGGSPIMGELAWITDGDKEAADGSLVELDPFLQYITIDLQQDHEIYAVLFWHYHKQARVYLDVIVQVARDPDFTKGVVTLFNNDDDNTARLGAGTDLHYVETSEGKLIDAQGVCARYVRLYSNGNNSNDQNHYLEVEVFGIARDSAKQAAKPTNRSLAPLPLKLPKPMFVGTPTNMEGLRLSRSRPRDVAHSSARPTQRQQHPPMAHGGVVAPNGAAVDAMFFRHYGANAFIDTEDDRFSTFGIDVDTGSYTLCRQYIRQGNLPPAEAVRVEEFVNAFDYHYPDPQGGNFALYADAVPWRLGEGRRNSYLLRIGLQSRRLTAEQRKPAVLTFVIDVSGSMSRDNRLGLVKRSLHYLVGQLRPNDRVGIAVYGSSGRTVLDHVSLNHGEQVTHAIESLSPGGSTNAEEGLRVGYIMAQRAYEEGCINRVILCSDGVANVGRTGPDQILEVIRDRAEGGIALSTLGFGMGNYNDVLMEQLADKGDGHYAYIDSFDRAREEFGTKLIQNLQVVARDVKVQVDFNARVVRSYRLIGYENRAVPDEKFRDNTQDGGEIGPGHAVTALYEVKLNPGQQGKIAILNVRYKHPETFRVTELAAQVSTDQVQAKFTDLSEDVQLAALVTEFAEILRQSPWAEGATLAGVLGKVKRLQTRYSGHAQIAELSELISRCTALTAARDIRRPRPLALTVR